MITGFALFSWFSDPFSASIITMLPSQGNRQISECFAKPVIVFMLLPDDPKLLKSLVPKLLMTMFLDMMSYNGNMGVEQSMLMLSRRQYLLDERGGALFVLASDSLPCPVCTSSLYAIGRRFRLVISTSGQKRGLMIRRLRCSNVKCRRIHHELPDIVVPYKRHCAQTIQNVIEGNLESVPLESSVIWRIRLWWRRVEIYFGKILESLAARIGVQASERPSFRDRIQAAVNGNSWIFAGSCPASLFNPFGNDCPL